MYYAAMAARVKGENELVRNLEPEPPKSNRLDRLEAMLDSILQGLVRLECQMEQLAKLSGNEIRKGND